MAAFKGELHWAKVLGDPVPGYDPSEKEWTFDVTVDDTARQVLTDLGLADKIKNKDDDRGDFMTFKRKGIKSDGEPAKPIQVVDKNKNPWPEDKLLGNGTVAAVQFIADEWTYGKKSGIRAAPLKIMILEHVEYAKDELTEFMDADDFDDVPFDD